jgi:hypothetical protein
VRTGTVAPVPGLTASAIASTRIPSLSADVTCAHPEAE